MNLFLMKVFMLVILSINTHIILQAQAVLSIQTKNLKGNTSTIADVATGELIVLDFWATWCKPCVKSIPKLVSLSEKYDLQKVSFVGINEDSPRNTNKVKPFVQSLGVSYPVLLDPDQEIMTELLVNSYPTLIIINADAEVLFIHEGYTSGDELLIEKEINKLLEKNE